MADPTAIGELDRLAKTYTPRYWSQRDEAILRKYHGRVSNADIGHAIRTEDDPVNKAGDIRLFGHFITDANPLFGKGRTLRME